jgi:dihydroorotate dehydrogenase
LRNFHEEKLLSNLLSKLNELKKIKKTKCPIALKISPDLKEKEISNINELVLKFNIDGIILTNTSNQSRENLSDIKKNEVGGLSGLPLQNLSLKFIKNFYKSNKGKVPIIGVGGIDSGQSAFEKIAAGATVIQLYTGMVYKGPGVVKNIKKELIEILKREKISNIQQAIGINS